MQLIINADDYGWDEQANEGILRLCQMGKLDGVSIMSNFAGEEALHKLVIFQPKVRLGLHVVLNEGSPVSSPREVYSLVNKHGKFYSSRHLWLRYLLGRVQKSHIHKEIEAQADKLRKAGVVLFHADSHQHIHHFPFLGKTILDSLKSVGIESVRNSLPLERGDMRRKLLYVLCKLSLHTLSSFSHNQLLITYLAVEKFPLKEVLKKKVSQLPSDKIRQVELMCHPALADREGSYLRRKQEFDFLASFD